MMTLTQRRIDLHCHKAERAYAAGLVCLVVIIAAAAVGLYAGYKAFDLLCWIGGVR